MKTLLTALVLVMATVSASAQDKILKECSVSMKQMGGSDQVVNMTFQILAKNNKSVYSKISQSVGGVSGSSEDVAEISEGTVRENLSAQSEVDNLNQAEGLVVHAMMLTEDPVMEGTQSAGLDLKQVRSAKMYTVGEKTNMGSSTIVEARDAKGKVLGSFLGGFLVSPCK